MGGPTYCYDIPVPYRANVAECAGAGNANPSWCNDIPTASRDYTPDCAGADNSVPNWCYSIPVADRDRNPSCVGAGTATVPPQVQNLVCSVVPFFIRPLVGSILGCQ